MLFGPMNLVSSWIVIEGAVTKQEDKIHTLNHVQNILFRYTFGQGLAEREPLIFEGKMNNELFCQILQRILLPFLGRSFCYQVPIGSCRTTTLNTVPDMLRDFIQRLESSGVALHQNRLLIRTPLRISGMNLRIIYVG